MGMLNVRVNEKRREKCEMNKNFFKKIIIFSRKIKKEDGLPFSSRSLSVFVTPFHFDFWPYIDTHTPGLLYKGG
jgi:hypothetical protein